MVDQHRIRWADTVQMLYKMFIDCIVYYSDTVYTWIKINIYGLNNKLMASINYYVHVATRNHAHYSLHSFICQTLLSNVNLN